MKTKERLAYIVLDGVLFMTIVTMSGCMTMLYLTDGRSEKYKAIKISMSEKRVEWLMREKPNKIIEPVGENVKNWCYGQRAVYQSRFYFEDGVVVRKKRIKYYGNSNQLEPSKNIGE